MIEAHVLPTCSNSSSFPLDSHVNTDAALLAPEPWEVLMNCIVGRTLCSFAVPVSELQTFHILVHYYAGRNLVQIITVRLGSSIFPRTLKHVCSHKP